MALTVVDFIMVFTITILLWGSIITLVVLTIRALIKYLRSDKTKAQAPTQRTLDTAQGAEGSVTAAAQAETLQSLGEALKNARVARKFTQEYVADALEVSRQAVSKWENGTSDPSTSNLIALAKLYGVSVEALLAQVVK